MDKLRKFLNGSEDNQSQDETAGITAQVGVFLQKQLFFPNFSLNIFNFVLFLGS